LTGFSRQSRIRSQVPVPRKNGYKLTSMSMLFRDIQYDSHTWSVSELTSYIRELFDIDFRLQDVIVSGEISNFTRARSGHFYFTLKDERAQLKCVMWQSSAKRLGFDPGDGDAVIAQGHVSVYEAGGVYQLYAESLEPAGRGDLAMAFEELKETLASEGLFDESHKKLIPEIPRKIGLVTSADAAALRDILNVLSRRWPLVSVLIAPALVQGREAPPQIIRSLQWLDGRNDIDTIIITRGGGSLEDLWAFNDPSLARAIFAAQHPIIVGVGHQTDFTIADFVADLRAPTPSSAAELAVPEQAEYKAAITAFEAAMNSSMVNFLREKRSLLNGLTRNLKLLSPRAALDNNRQQVDWLISRMDKAMRSILDGRQSQLSVVSATLETMNPVATLARGYAILRKVDGHIIHSINDVVKGDLFSVQVLDGRFGAKVIEEEQWTKDKLRK
jgi:exodeoxyribonuclease VII large subunit